MRKYSFLIVVLITLISALNNYAQSISLSGQIEESFEDGDSAMLALTQTGNFEKFEAVLTLGNWTFSNMPVGVDVASVSFVDTVTVKITFTGNRTQDYDSDIDNFTVTVPNSEIQNYSGGDLSDNNGFKFNCDNDSEVLTWTDDGTITEGSENGELITINIAGGTFADPLTEGSFTITNLPNGVTRSTLTRVDPTTVTFTLVGNRIDDFDNSDITLDMDVLASQIDETSLDFDLTSGVVITRVWDAEVLTWTDDGTINEGFEDGELITINLVGGTFVDPLVEGNFSFTNVPDGVTRSLLTRVNSTTVTFTLVGNRLNDFDSDFTLNMFVDADQINETSTDRNLTTGAVITADPDPELMSWTDDGSIMEGNEDGEIITISLSGGTFIQTINAGSFNFTNLPTGVTKGTVSRVDSVTVTVALSGNRTGDFSSDITLDMDVDASQVNETGSAFDLTSGAVITALDVTWSDDGTINEGSENGELITITLGGGQFIASPSEATFTINGLPNGVTRSVLNRVNNTTITFTLVGNRLDDFDASDIVPDIDITGDQIIPATSDFNISTGVTIIRDNDAEVLSWSHDGLIDEGKENGEVITISLTGGTFVDPLTDNQFTLTNAPAGVTRSAVNRVNSTTITFTLLGWRQNDFDSDLILDMDVDASQVNETGSDFDLTTGVSITALNDTEVLTWFSDGLIEEGKEDGEVITVELTGGTFVPSIDDGSISIGNLPAGVTRNTHVRVDSNTVTMTLSGNRTSDYDSDRNLTLDFGDMQVNDTTGPNFTTLPPITITAFDESAALTGTIIDGTVDKESDVIWGKGSTFVLTLTDEMWVADMGDNSASTTALLDAFTSSIPSAWSTIRSKLDYNAVNRVSDYVVEITLPPVSDFYISENDGTNLWIYLTIPTSVLQNSINGLSVANCYIDNEPTQIFISGTIQDGTSDTELDLFNGGSTIIVTVRNDRFEADLGGNNGNTTNFLSTSRYTSTSNEIDDVIDGADYNDVTRLNDTMLLLTLPSCNTYWINTDEVITIRIDDNILIGSTGTDYDAVNTITVQDLDPAVKITGTVIDGPMNKEGDIQTGGGTIILTLENDLWMSEIGTNNWRNARLLESFSGNVDWSTVETKLLESTNGSAYVSRSGQVVTITLPVVSGYLIGSNETVILNLANQCLVHLASGTVLGDRDITIIDEVGKPTATIAGNDTICDDGSDADVFLILSGIAPWTVKYLIDGTTEDSVTNINISPHILRTNIQGTYTIKQVRDAVQTETAPSARINGSANVTIRSLPVVTLSPATQPLIVSTDSVGLVGTPGGGIYSGEGVTAYDSTFHPNWLDVSSIYPVTYTYTDEYGCTNSAVSSYTITDGSADLLYPGNRTIYCQEESPFQVTGIPNNPLIFQLTPDVPGALTYVGNVATIDPSFLTPGVTYTLGYYYADPFPILYNENFTIQQVGVPTFPIIGNNDQFCEVNDTIQFSATTPPPAGGSGNFSFTGNAGSLFTDLINDPTGNTAKFVPFTMGDGVDTIKYFYTTIEGCVSSTISKAVKVDSLPWISFDIDSVYNYIGEADTIYGYPAGINGFFNPLTLNANDEFGVLDPSDFAIGYNQITYSYTDSNLCSNIDTTYVRIKETNGEINNLSSYFCYFDEQDTIDANIIDSEGDIVSFLIDNKTVNTNWVINDTNLIIYPDSVGEGIHELKFIYQYGTAFFEVIQNFSIDSIASFDYTDLDSTYCNNDEKVDLDPFINDGGAGSFSITGSVGIVGEDYYPQLLTPGADTVIITYTIIASGCSKSVTQEVIIKGIPKPKFSILDRCVIPTETKDSTYFINTSIPVTTITSFSWNFGDPTTWDANTSNLGSPAHHYTSDGTKNIVLIANDQNGCSTQLDTIIDLGKKPTAIFSWGNECYNGDSIEFYNTSESTVTENNYYWKFYNQNGYDSIYHDSLLSFKYYYSEVNNYDVELIHETNLGCSDTLKQTVHLRSTVPLLSDQDYFEDLESGMGGWVAQADNIIGENNWSFGSEDFFGTYSGNNAYTVLVGNKKIKEQSYVLSPCFDFRELERPMIKMKIKKSFEKDRNAAALQYSTDNGTTWSNIGSFDDGINWYNSFLINEGPGGKNVGWTGVQPFDEDSAWLEARQSLDVINMNPGVRLRIIYSSDGNIIEDRSRGFAFDDIWIGERKRRVLLENMTNSASASSKTANEIINEVVSSTNVHSSDIVDIHYHLDYPGADPMNADNPTLSSTRSFYYGVSSVPYSFMDGGNNEGEYDYITEATEWNTADLRIRVLEDPKFNVNLETTIEGDELSVKAGITALDSILSTEVSLHVVVVEKEITELTGAAGETSFRNVVKKMLPNPAGTSYVQAWQTGASKTIDLSWTLENVYDPNQLMVVAFVQDENTKEVYQAAIDDSTSTFTSINPIAVQPIEFMVYPNPSSDYVNIVVAKPFENNANISIYSTTGTLIENKELHTGETFISFELSNYVPGLYFIQLYNNEGMSGYKKLIINR